jgi:hypothetical protein
MALAGAIYVPFLLFLLFWHSSFSIRITAEDGVTFIGEAKDFLTFGRLNSRVAYPMQLRGKPAQKPPFTLRPPYNKPLFSIIEAGAFAIFGVSVSVATWTCFSFYVLIGLFLFITVFSRWGPAAAHAATIAFLTSYNTLFFSVSNHADMAFAFFMSISAFSVFLWRKNHRWIGGVLAGAAVLTRPGGVLIAFMLFLAVIIMELWDEDAPGLRMRRAAVFLATVAVPVAIIMAMNLKYHGGPFNFYDMKGLEFSNSRGILNYAYYQPEIYAKNAPSSSTPSAGSASPMPPIHLISGMVLDLVTGLWKREPYAVAFLLVGLLWPPLWARDRRAAALLGVGGLALAMQFIIGKTLAGHVKELLWMYPYVCLGVGVAAGDIWRAGFAPGYHRLRLALLMPAMAVFLSGALGSMVTYLQYTTAPDFREATYQQREWFLEADKITALVPPGGLLIGKSPLEFLFGWRAGTYSLLEPADFPGLLGSLSKLRTSHVFLAANSPRDVFSHRSQECAYDSFPQAAPYARLYYSNRFFCLYRLDADKMRQDFAADIAALPY